MLLLSVFFAFASALSSGADAEASAGAGEFHLPFHTMS